jgi:hypothetical protein
MFPSTFAHLNREFVPPTSGAPTPHGPPRHQRPHRVTQRSNPLAALRSRWAPRRHQVSTGRCAS